jgi:uncharacterized protein
VIDITIFLDASYILALFNEEDVHHQKAVALSSKIDSRMLGEPFTSNEVIDEVASVALRKYGEERAVYVLKEISKRTIIFTADKHIFQLGMKRFFTSSHHFSFTDCMILTIMAHSEKKHVATFDKEFKKENLTVVP